jgi:hypothetical protein
LFRRFEPRSASSRVTLLVVIPALLSLPVSHSAPWPYYTALPLTLIAHGGGLVFFTVAHRLSPFHPLAKYPGPIIAKSSKWWVAYISFRGDLHRYYKCLHDRYGDIVRIGLGNPSCVTLPLTHFQAPTSSLFATLPSSTLYSAKVAFPKDHVRTRHLYNSRLPTCDDQVGKGELQHFSPSEIQ